MNEVERCLPTQCARTSTPVVDPSHMTVQSNPKAVSPLLSSAQTTMDVEDVFQTLNMEISKPSHASPPPACAQTTKGVSIDKSQAHSEEETIPLQTTIDVSLDVCESQSNTKKVSPLPTSAQGPVVIEDDMMDQDGDHPGTTSPSPSSPAHDHDHLVENRNMGQSALNIHSPEPVGCGAEKEIENDPDGSSVPHGSTSYCRIQPKLTIPPVRERLEMKCKLQSPGNSLSVVWLRNVMKR